jgi:ankyrin repeat protein
MSNELFTAVRAREREKVLHILKQQPQSATARDADGATPLHYAAKSYDREIVEALLADGTDVSERDLLTLCRQED